VGEVTTIYNDACTSVSCCMVYPFVSRCLCSIPCAEQQRTWLRPAMSYVSTPAVTTAASCCALQCTNATYSLRPSDLVCTSCPSNANCSGEGMQPYETLPVDGYW
jgi:hypothetical protein